MTYKYLLSVSIIVCLPFVYLLRLLKRKLFKPKIKKILVGVEPVINNKYWSDTLSLDGYKSQTVVIGLFDINKKNDFDCIINSKFKFFIWTFKYICCFDIVVLSFRGGFIGRLPIKNTEPFILKLLNIKSIILGYGSDIHIYEKINQCSYLHALSSFYPQKHNSRLKVLNAIETWQKNADFMTTAMCFGNGFYRNDILTPNYLFFPVEKIQSTYISRKRSKICIVHSPNHRIIKGTEFINQAIEKIKHDFDIEYLLLEKRPNEEVLEILQNKADILIEKLVGPGYALSAIEAMSYGVPVVGSVNNGDWSDLDKSLNRYSFLGECPIVPANIESIESVLRNLCESPDQLNLLSIKSRSYVELYHSYKSGSIFFKEVLQYLDNQSHDLKNFYHPVIGGYRQFNN